jgi:hypothetical protein
VDGTPDITSERVAETVRVRIHNADGARLYAERDPPKQPVKRASAFVEVEEQIADGPHRVTRLLVRHSMYDNYRDP